MTSANFATYPGPNRLTALRQAVGSIRHQVDIVRICWNNYTAIPTGFEFAENYIPPIDLADNGKFVFRPTPNEIYFTCDDDILYPPNYIANTLPYLSAHPIVTYHGRVLSQQGTHSYYRGGHLCYSYLSDVTAPIQVHVGGTGVMAIDTDVIDFESVSLSPILHMSDLILSRAIAPTPIICLPHSHGYFKAIKTGQDTIGNKFREDESKQIAIMKEILTIFGL